MTLQSQAIRWIELEETGSENSISPAAAPAKPFKVSMVAVTWRLAGWPPERRSTNASAMRCSRFRSS